MTFWVGTSGWSYDHWSGHLYSAGLRPVERLDVYTHQFRTVELNASYVVMSGANLPCVLQATAPFVYIRLHGPDHGFLYAGYYSNDDLAWWAARMGEWKSQGRTDVYAYFNNDSDGNAVHNARALAQMLGS